MRHQKRSQPFVVQALYYVVSGLWPVVHLRSFMALTGPKEDRWLVKSFGLLTAALGASMLTARDPAEHRLARRVGIASATAIATADVWYVLRGRISPIYLADALLEGVFVLAGLSRRGR